MTDGTTTIPATSAETKESTSDAPKNAAASSATIFVGNLPFDTRDDQLEKVFSEIGPIKRAFVVKDKDNRSKSRGCGYVQFVLPEDADKCLKATKTIGNRQLRLNYAAKKPKHAKRKLLAQLKAKQEGGEDGETETAPAEKENDEPEVKKIKIPPVVVKQERNFDSKTDLQRTIVLTGLTAKVKRKAFRILCETFGEVEKIVYPVPDREEVTAYVRFKEYKSAIRAMQKIPGKKVKKSGVLSACLLTKEGKMPTKKKLALARLIVRNLSFKCEEEDLRTQFSVFGKVVNVHIPTKMVNEKPVKIGCGFVQFADTANAKVALEKMNLKEIMERQVVVDWAVEKDKFTAEKEAAEEAKVKKEEEQKTKKEKGGKKEKKGKVVEEVEEEEDEDIDEEEEDDMEVGSEDEDENEDQDMDEEDDVDNEEEDDEDEEEGVEGDEGDEEEDEGDEDEDEEEDEEEEEKPKKQMKDAKEGRTIFIRNLSYNVDEGMLEEEFDKYGEIEYTKLVMDHDTGRGKGTAFIKFKEKKSCDVCVEEFTKKADAGVNVMIDNRAAFVSLAVTKGKLGEMEKEKNDSKKETDKRNLYLASEGIVTRNSPAAEGLSDADLKKREKALMEKKAKLKNPNYFISRTRLCIRNLPLTADAETLNRSIKKFIPKEIRIGKIKIMRSTDRRDLSGQPRSLGFGFIEMEQHEHALALLRAVNNNPKVFGDKRRPILEFSVENAKALKILELKRKRLDTKLQQLAENGGDGEEDSGENRGEEEVKKEITKEEKKAHMAKAYEKKVKRIARYKRKREAKKQENADKNAELNSVATETKPKQNKTSDNAAEKSSTPGTETTTTKTNIASGVVAKPAPSRKAQKKASEEEAKFTNMVEQYKKKILGGNKTNTKRDENRWFE